MLLSATEAIYSGNLPVKKLFTNNKLTYKPEIFKFAELTSAVLSLSVSNAGGTGSIFNGIWTRNNLSTSLFTKSGASTLFLNRSGNIWLFVRVFPFPTTIFYQATGSNPYEPPLTGWVSLSSTYDPPPTLTNIITPLSTLHANITSNIKFKPEISVNDYFLDQNSLIGYTSSNFFTSLTEISATFNILLNLDLDFFPNLKTCIYNYTPDNIDRLIFNSSNIENINVIRQPNNIQIHNNFKLKDLTINDNVTFSNNNITNCPSITSLNLGSQINNGAGCPITDVDITKFPNLEALSIDAPNLSSIQYLQDYPNLKSLQLYCNLSSSKILDDFLNLMSNKDLKSCALISRSSFFRRTSASNQAWFNIYKKRFFLPTSSDTDFLLELDPSPSASIPSGYYPATLGNDIVVFCPLSSNGNNSYVQHKSLSGIYTKIPNTIHNNRDIFKNINDFYILYDNANTRWTLVGPTSSSSTIWLSAIETAGDIGNVPSIGWDGPSIDLFPYQDRWGWYHQTAVFSTRMYLFSSLTFNGTRHGYVLSAYNPDFYWSDYDFSGIGYQNVIDPSWNEKLTSVSPVHFIETGHWNGPMNPGTIVKFIDKNNNVTTRTILCSVGGAIGSDICLGIYDQPVSVPAYPICSIANTISSFSATSQLSNFLWGPSQTGRVGIMVPTTTTVSDTRPITFPQITSIPKSLWFAQNPDTADSSTPFWYANPVTKQLAVCWITLGRGQDQKASGSGPASTVYSSLYNMATALCKQFYGDPLMYQLTAYNF